MELTLGLSSAPYNSLVRTHSHGYKRAALCVENMPPWEDTNRDCVGAHGARQDHSKSNAVTYLSPKTLRSKKDLGLHPRGICYNGTKRTSFQGPNGAEAAGATGTLPSTTGVLGRKAVCRHSYQVHSASRVSPGRARGPSSRNSSVEWTARDQNL